MVKSLPAVYLVFGKEIGESGTPHLQGFITFHKNYRLSALKKLLPSAHFETARGTSLQASDYCKKEGDFFESGTVPSQGKRSDLESVGDMIKSGASLKRIAEEHPTVMIKYHKGIAATKSILSESRETSDVRGIWLFGVPGSGKSHLARTIDDLYIKPQNKWWDGYANEAHVLIDDFDKGGKCLGHYIKLWADKYKTTGEIKGASISLNHKWLIITSNYEPSEIWDDDPTMLAAIERRFAIRCCWHHSREQDQEWFKNITTSP